ncbi:SPFH domain-containing protein [Bacteroides acidifaciens]|uniref:SPFH domain-containing protein n=1 Tax=Bacteroides acidifaciens TaxID=85831 RepID=UPI0025A994BD|nr:SPFH domain-containing protein [Bacteroides acidifaciens]
MALIDVVKCEVNDKELVYKFPSDDLRIGTQLVVYSGQTAFFVKGGKILDQFESGTYTLKSENIPLLNKLINIPFGNNSPFKAEVWFINQLAILDSKWGTATPIQLEDPKYDIIVPIRAYGQYGLKVKDPRLFLETLVGNMTSFSTEKVSSYFKGKVMSQLTDCISCKIVQDKISILTINSHLIDISQYLRQAICADFEKYGLGLEDFTVMSINVPEDDPSFTKLKEAKDLAARLKITGKDVYQVERSFDILDKAASNEGNGNNMLNMGVGLGAGLNIGSQVGTLSGQMINTSLTPPPLPQSTIFYLVINGQQQGPYDINTITTYITNQQINADTLVWKQGMSSWAKISTLLEFVHLFNCPPPLPIV